MLEIFPELKGKVVYEKIIFREIYTIHCILKNMELLISHHK